MNNMVLYCTYLKYRQKPVVYNPLSCWLEAQEQWQREEDEEYVDQHRGDQHKVSNWCYQYKFRAHKLKDSWIAVK